MQGDSAEAYTNKRPWNILQPKATFICCWRIALFQPASSRWTNLSEVVQRQVDAPASC